jgi:TolB-like protein
MPEEAPGTPEAATDPASPAPSAVHGPSADTGSDVFVSYASQDAAVANSIVEALERSGLRCWIAPRDVVPGTLYADGIVRAISGAKVFVLVLSEYSVASSHVGKEIERASSKRKPIIALRTDMAPLAPAFEYFLSESQWIDLGPGGTDAAAAKLVHAVRSHIDTHGNTEPRVESASPARGQAAPAFGKKWIVAGGVVAVSLALAYLVVDKFWLSKHVTTEQRTTAATNVVSDKSIAVLPFADMSEKKDQEYFADGMAEEILDLLAKVPSLTVIGRTSSFQFKGTNQDLHTIGTKLGAAYVLEGSVRRSNDRIRVTAQLIDARIGAHLWSDAYDRPAGDVLQVQDEIATGLARALQVSVGADRKQSRRRPKSDEAYDLYLRGLHAFGRADIDGIATAITYLQQALDIDPDFIDAAEVLADAFYWQANAGIVPSRVGYEQARRAAESVLKRDPALGLAHAVLGAIHSDYDRDWAGADLEFKRALALAPHDGKVVMLSAQLPVALGQLDSARRIYKQSLAYDPLSPDSYFFLSWVELRSGKWAEAETAARKTIEIAPAYEWGHAQVGFALLMRGDRAGALAEVDRETDPMIRQEGLALVYHALGRKNDSDAALRELTAEGADREAFEIASVYSYRGERDEALKWLDRAYAQRDPNLFFVKWNPFLKNLEADSRFKAFLTKINLPE